MNQPPTLPPNTHTAPEKKGIPLVAWMGIGCGGLLILAIVGGVVAFMKIKEKFDDFTRNPEKAAAELVVSMNPNLKMISQDKQNGKMTIRTSNGEEMTLSYKDIAAGRITVTDANGNTTNIGSTDLSSVPAWVPLPADLTNAVSLFHKEGGGKVEGQIAGQSPQGKDALKAFFEDAGSKIGTSSNSYMESGNFGVNTLKFTGNGQVLKIVITSESGKPSQLNIYYSEGK